MYVPLLLTAMPWERKAILRSFVSVVRFERASVPTWEIAREPAALRVVQTGIGQQAAARAAQAIDDAAEQPWIVIGCAGGLDPTLRPGDVVVAESVIGAGHSLACDVAETRRLVAAVHACGLVAHVGPLASRSAPLLSAEEKRGEWLRSAAIAVEMEGAAVAVEAARRGVPFAMVRVVLDDAATSVRADAGIPGTGLGELPLALVGDRLSCIATALGDVL